MLNVIPCLIQEGLALPENERSGSLTAATLFVDIAGFTSMTRKLMNRGKQGAEDLSVLINKVYRPLIETVHRNGGYIAVFAGDSITAVFPGGSGRAALDSARSINRHFRRRKGYYLRYSGGEGIRIRTGLAAGKVCWAIFGRARKAYLFHGDPILNCSLAVMGKPPGSLVRHESFKDLETSSTSGPAPSSPCRIKPSSAAQFVPEHVLSARGAGEFRNAVSVFLAFRWRKVDTGFQKAVSRVIASSERYGGYWNGVFCDDKGIHALVVFGAPVSWENNRKRAVDFASDAVDEGDGRLRAGIAGGTVFAGTVGTSRRCTYTILGDRVNLAAIFMQKAPWGQVLVSDDIASAVRRSYAAEQVTQDQGALFSIKRRKDEPEGNFFRGPMVGREAELKALIDFCNPILEGRFGGIALVRGPAGIGKSRLLHELGNTLSGQVRTFVLQTDQVLRKSLNPFVRFLTGYFGSGTGEETDFERAWANFLATLQKHPDKEKAAPVADELVRTRPFLRVLTGFQSRDSLYDSLDARGRFENTLFALKEFVKGLSLITPTVIILEDVHWLDPDSVSLMESLFRNTEGFPFAIIASSRNAADQPPEWIPEGDRVRKLEITMAPLHSQGERMMMEELLSAAPSKELADFILGRTQGNPFYMEQFCRYLEENGLLHEIHGSLFLAGNLIEVPEGINAVIVARIDRLSIKLKELVQTASVLGREFDIQILSAILRGDSGVIYPLLEEGESESIWNALNEVRYIFRHSILRDTVYSMQMNRQLRRLHLLAAEAIEDLFGELKSRYSDIAYHLEKAGESSRAAVFLKKAADFARDEYRNEEALNLYGRLLPLTTGTEERIITEIDIANILIDMGRRDEAQGILFENMKKAEEAKSLYPAALCYRNMAKLHHRQGNNSEAISYLERAHAIFTELNIQWEIAATHNILGNINTVLGNYDDALKNFEDSNEAAKTAGDAITPVLNLSNVGNIHLYRYELDQAESYYFRAIERAKEINDKKALANALNNLAVVNYYRSDLKKCRQYLDDFVEISTEIGNKEGLAYIFGNIGILHQELGEYPEALDYHERQIGLARELGDLYNITKAMHQTGQVRKALGEYPEAVDRIVQAIDLCKRTGDVRNQAQCVRDLAAIHLDMGDYPLALNEFQAAFELGEAGSDREVCSSCRLYQAGMAAFEGNRDLAWKRAEEAIDINREIGEHRSLLRTLVLAAEVFIETGKPARAREILAEAGELIEEDRCDETAGRYRVARCLVSADEDPDAVSAELTALSEAFCDQEELAAEIQLHLYRLTGKAIYRRRAAESYETLLEKLPKALYAERLKGLQR